jgi:hypothetical protein
MLAGSAQQVLDKLAPWAERGMRHTMVWTMFGHMPPQRAAESLQRFGEEVLPHLQRINPGRPGLAPLPRGAHTAIALTPR